MHENIRKNIRKAYLEDEVRVVRGLIDQINLSAQARENISAHASDLVRQVRSHSDPGVMQSFLSEYGLSTREGVALMCLAEALLRVPDAETIDELIQDKIVPHNWASHVGDSGSILVNASTWALMLTGKMLEDEPNGVVGALQGMVKRLGEPLIRVAVERAMREMGEQFVLGRDISEATRNGKKLVDKGYTYSFDMLGEAARTDADAVAYHHAYLTAIDSIASRAHSDDLRENPGISVKLSALHPRYEFTQRNSMMPVMCARLLELAQAAANGRIGFNIDAEEADRLDLSLDIIETILADPSLHGWDGFGVVVQAYGQRAGYVLDWLYALARRLDRNIMVRLVKGAYWDTEIKRAQVMGLAGYPVFTRKSSTDLSYIACAGKLMAMRDRIYPQFATHNAHTISAVLGLAGEQRDDFEFQRLHGMGDALHDIVLQAEQTRCRIYAPVGTHEDLLAYLVRRLLENGANSSFVNQLVDPDISPAQIAEDPVALSDSLEHIANPGIVKPAAIYGERRINSTGWDINDPTMSAELDQMRAGYLAPYSWFSNDSCDRIDSENDPVNFTEPVFNPAELSDKVGIASLSNPAAIDQIVDAAVAAQPSWENSGVGQRAALLLRVADLYEASAGELFALLAREAGKTLIDAIAELREAVDFLRYYAVNADSVESNTSARGVIVCISPWNFPLAIFTGQIAAALVTGNAVIAKPAEQTPLIAATAVALMHQAGIDKNILQIAPGSGETVGAALSAHSAIGGVCFTGSTTVAEIINRQLAKTAPADAMLIAETGGLNAMIVDSTALLEQAVMDIVEGAFRSAGQRCSALRIVYVQREIRDQLLTMLYGAMDALTVDNPLNQETDVGPIIDCDSRDHIQAYCDQKEQQGKLLYKTRAPESGYYIAPAVIQVKGINDMKEEIFGPVLHLASFSAEQIEQVLDEINGCGYGLTFGLHTRIDRRVQQVVNRMRVGNLYVNRNQIGAIVGSQPFGGEGFSGTGPKAGGPHYLRRFRVAHDKNLPLATEVDVADHDLIHSAVASLEAAVAPSASDSIPLLRDLLRGHAGESMSLAAALDCGPVDLPGPTGESNQLTLHPVGTILCLSHDPDNLIAMVIQALRAGNKVIAVGRSAKRDLKLLSDPRLALKVINGAFDSDWLDVLKIDLVAADRSYDTGSLRRGLARRHGPIVRLISELNYPAAYTTERSICIDTTAAGGNAALLAESE